MLSNIGADPHKFLTADILNDQVFMTVIIQFSYEYETFHRLREKYEARKMKKDENLVCQIILQV